MRSLPDPALFEMHRVARTVETRLDNCSSDLLQPRVERPEYLWAADAARRRVPPKRLSVLCAKPNH